MPSPSSLHAPSTVNISPPPPLLPRRFRGPHKCVMGMAGPYPCSNTDLVARVTDEYQGEAYFNDIWGWTDPVDGHEYVIQGMKSGT